MIAAVDMLFEHAEHLPIRSFAAVVERWLMWADPDGAWRDQTESIDNRTAHVVAANGEVSIGASGGDALTAEKLRNIFAHFVELEFRKDCEARRAEHGDRADEFPLPRTDAPASLRRRWWRSSNAPTPPLATARCPIRWSTSSAINAPCTTCWVAPGSRLADGETLGSRPVDQPADRRGAGRVRRRPDLDAHPPLRDLLGSTDRTATVDPGAADRPGAAGRARRQLDRHRSWASASGCSPATPASPPPCSSSSVSIPGCEVPADRCQIDHNESHSAGGRTDQANAGPECGPHNRHKYEHGWRTRRADNGRIYNIRSDGTLILFVGERPPPFTRADHVDAIHNIREITLEHLKHEGIRAA